jgi:hypothetical protein
MPDLEGLLDRLVASGVEFVVVGGMAAVAHGSLTLTRDVEVCVSLARTNLVRLFEALEDLPIGSGSCRILSIEALIRSKEALRREKDLPVLRELRAIRERRGG